MPNITAYMCEDCACRIELSETYLDSVGDRYHIDARTGNPHPITEESVEWDCSCFISPPCGGCVENLWEENV